MIRAMCYEYTKDVTHRQVNAADDTEPEGKQAVLTMRNNIKPANDLF